MLDLFKSEFARYRLFAWLFCVAQILIWTFVAKFTLILEPGSSKNVVLMLSCVFSGAGFAILAMSLHRRKSHWNWLVHRPLPIEKIHLSISGSHLALLFIGFVLPFTSTVIFLDLFTNNVVELRHYMYCLHMMLVVSVAYFCGSFAVLSSGFGPFLAIWSVTYLILRNPQQVMIDIAVDVLFVAVTFYLARSSFKVDLQQKSQKKSVIVLSALALQPALMVLLLMSQAIYFHVPLMALGQHPHEDDSINAYGNFVYQDSKDQYIELLGASNHEQKDSFSRQMALAEFERVWSRNRYPDIRHQLFVKDNQFALLEPGESHTWIFSHNDMVFAGRDLVTEEALGYIGPKGFIEPNVALTDEQRFKSVPGVINQSYVTAGNQLLLVDFKLKEVQLRHQIAEGDQYVAPFTVAFDKVWLRTETALHIVDAVDFRNTHKVVESTHVIQHPVSSNRDLDIDFTEVTDGYLVRYGSNDYRGYAKGGSALWLVRHNGEIEPLASLAFNSQRTPDWIYFQSFIFSPIALNLLEASFGTIMQFNPLPPDGYRYFWQQGHSTYVLLLSLLMALVSAALTWILSATRVSNASHRTLWTLLNLVTSLPGLLAFLLLNRKAVQLKS